MNPNQIRYEKTSPVNVRAYSGERLIGIIIRDNYTGVWNTYVVNLRESDDYDAIYKAISDGVPVRFLVD